MSEASPLDATFQALVTSARRCAKQGDFTRARSAFGHALSIQDEPALRIEFGDFLSRTGEISAARIEYKHALQRANDSGDHRCSAVVLNQLAASYRQAGDYPTAAVTQRRSLAEELRHSSNQLDLRVDLSNSAADAIAEKDYVTAERLLRRSLALEIFAQSSAGEAADCGNLGLVQAMSGKTTTAISWLRRALRLHRQLNDDRGVASDLMNLALIFGVLDRPKRARRLLRKAVVLLEQNSICDLLSQATWLLIDMERRVALRELDPSRN